MTDEWVYTKDADGDWRGTCGDRRTRLKGSREWAMQDVAAGRLQVRRGDVWVDEIDGPRLRWTIEARPE